MKRLVFVTLLLLLGASSFAQKSGYEKCIEINSGAGLDDYQKYTFGIGMINGYRQDAFFLGVGVGYEYLRGLYYKTLIYRGSALPTERESSYCTRNNLQVYGRLKADLSKTKVSPFLSVDLGYNIGLSDNEIKMANGFFFEPAFGIDFIVNEEQTIYFSIGYNGQNYDFEYITTLSGTHMENKLAGKINARFGFKF